MTADKKRAIRNDALGSGLLLACAFLVAFGSLETGDAALGEIDAISVTQGDQKVLVSLDEFQATDDLAIHDQEMMNPTPEALEGLDQMSRPISDPEMYYGVTWNEIEAIDLKVMETAGAPFSIAPHPDPLRGGGVIYYAYNSDIFYFKLPSLDDMI